MARPKKARLSYVQVDVDFVNSNQFRLLRHYLKENGCDMSDMEIFGCVVSLWASTLRENFSDLHHELLGPLSNFNGDKSYWVEGLLFSGIVKKGVTKNTVTVAGRDRYDALLEHRARTNERVRKHREKRKKIVEESDPCNGCNAPVTGGNGKAAPQSKSKSKSKDISDTPSLFSPPSVETGHGSDGAQNRGENFKNKDFSGDELEPLRVKASGKSARLDGQAEGEPEGPRLRVVEPEVVEAGEEEILRAPTKTQGEVAVTQADLERLEEMFPQLDVRARLERSIDWLRHQCPPYRRPTKRGLPRWLTNQCSMAMERNMFQKDRGSPLMDDRGSAGGLPATKEQRRLETNRRVGEAWLRKSLENSD